MMGLYQRIRNVSVVRADVEILTVGPTNVNVLQALTQINARLTALEARVTALE